MQIVIIIVVVLLGAFTMWFMSSNDAAETAVRNDEAATPVETSIERSDSDMGTVTPEESSQEYADGTYTKTGTYISPAGQEEVEISLTLENDTVTGATFTGKATNPGSVKNQAKFAAGFEAVVIGKSLDEIDLTVVNGSSLTPKGFMDAVASIKDDARQEG